MIDERKVDTSAEAVAREVAWLKKIVTDANASLHFNELADLLEALASARDEAVRERDEARTQYRCYSCKQVFNEDGGHGLAAEHFGSALRDLPKCCEIIDGTARWGGGPHDPFLRVLKTHYSDMTTQLTAANAELARLREANEWRPIESAPTDQNQILVGFMGQFSWYAFVAYALGATTTSSGHAPPTHWRPLPPPPKETEK